MNSSYPVTTGVSGRPTWRFLLDEMKPKGKMLTPFNIISLPIMVLGLALIVVRFWKGIGSITNLSQDIPWGLWIGFDILVGVGLAAGGFIVAATVYLFNIERFRPILRPTILTAFLGYLLVIAGLMIDLGRPWAIWHALIYWNPHLHLYLVLPISVLCLYEFEIRLFFFQCP